MTNLHVPSILLVLAGLTSAQQFGISQPPALVVTPSAFAFFSMGTVGDFDGDGDDDVALAATTGLRLLQNDGAGIWTDVSASLPISGVLSLTTLAFVDVDGDGRSELLVSGFGPNRLLGFTASGTWNDLSANLPAGLLPTRFVAGDFDGDGDTDLAGAGFVLAGSNDVLLVNQGAGTFVAVAPFPGQSQSIAAGDVDGDGDLDLLLGTRLWRNDGALSFTDVTATQLPGVPGPSTPVVAFGDVDGDGDLDLLAGSAAANDLAAFVNAGNGVFSLVPGVASAQSGANRFVALADVDDDGDLDLLRTCLGGPPLLSRNVGGVFVDDATALPSTAVGNAQLLPGDFDHDGDVDLIWMPAPGSGFLLTNRHRHLVVPQAPQIGQTWNVELWSEPGYGTVPRVAVLGLALVRLPQPVTLGAWGRLWLDPWFPILLEPVTLQPGGGPTVPSFVVPNAPWLQGVVLHAQALFEGDPVQSDLCFTGVVSSAIQ